MEDQEFVDGLRELVEWTWEEGHWLRWWLVSSALLGARLGFWIKWGRKARS